MLFCATSDWAACSVPNTEAQLESSIKFWNRTGSSKMGGVARLGQEHPQPGAKSRAYPLTWGGATTTPTATPQREERRDHDHEAHRAEGLAVNVGDAERWADGAYGVTSGSSAKSAESAS